MDVPMRMAGGDGPGFVERRRSVIPLTFESVERRRANLNQAGADLLTETARSRDALSAAEVLRGQLRGVPGQIDAARVQARADAKLEWQKELAAGIEVERQGILRACAQLAIERERYFSEVEGEVVRLALAIAARILHREAQLDPMLLAASVRLALEKVAGETGTTLRVPAQAAHQWQTLLAQSGHTAAEVIGDERLAAGDCILETTVGRVELGVPVQLEEIEKGFFDLLQKRPS